jgi:hypothetical protein
MVLGLAVSVNGEPINGVLTPAPKQGDCLELEAMITVCLFELRPALKASSLKRCESCSSQFNEKFCWLYDLDTREDKSTSSLWLMMASRNG